MHNLKVIQSEIIKENSEFKELVNFVYEYNENIIKMNRKYNHILTDQLLQKSSVKLNKRKIHRKNTYLEDESNLLKTMKSELKKEENLEESVKKPEDNENKYIERLENLNKTWKIYELNCNSSYLKSLALFFALFSLLIIFI